jgi:hypothetical protein
MWFHRAKSASRQRQKNAAYLATVTAMRAASVRPGAIPPGRIRMTMQFMQGKGQRAWDDDNAIAAMKGARDGVAEALGIDDRRFWIQPVEFRPARHAASCVNILLEWDDA